MKNQYLTVRKVDMKHLNNSELIQEARLLFSATPRATLTHVSYPPNFPDVPYLRHEAVQNTTMRKKRDVAAGLQFLGP